jgi:hypothetical protein
LNLALCRIQAVCLFITDKKQVFEGFAMKKFLSFVLSFFCCVTVFAAQSNEAESKHSDAEYQVAFAYFDTIDMARTHKTSMDLMISSLLPEINPQLSFIKPVIVDFMNRHFAYDVVKKKYADLYLDKFTADEIAELTKISQTPVMKKLIELQPELIAGGYAIGQQTITENGEELQKAIVAKVQERNQKQQKKVQKMKNQDSAAEK